MGTTPTGLPYPEPTAPVAEGANAIKGLAQAIRIVATSVTVANGAANPATATVSFPAGLFSSPPLVVSSSSSSNGATGLTAVSTTSATLTLTVRGTSGALPATMPGAVIIRCIAVQLAGGLYEFLPSELETEDAGGTAE